MHALDLNADMAAKVGMTLGWKTNKYKNLTNVLGKTGLSVLYLEWEFEKKEAKDQTRNNEICIFGCIKPKWGEWELI